MDTRSLLPRPRRALDDPGRWLASRLEVDGPLPTDGAAAALDQLNTQLAGHPASAARTSVLRMTPDPALASEGYRLVVGPSGVSIDHRDSAGLAHGLRTLLQWTRLHLGSQLAELPGLAVEDWPDLAERGVMLDISRDRVPRRDYLHQLVERLAEWKCNRLQLYMEAAFAYSGCEQAWQGTDPLSATELRELDAYCASHGIELVPNQQSFGHLHRFLVHERWRGLAECPEGVEHPFSPDREPFSLCPLDPGSLEFLEQLYDELLPCFRSRTVNVGLDETFDLGLGRSREACKARGKQAVYLDFLRSVHELLEQRGKRMQFWADIVLAEPGSVRELPRDAIAMAWGYEAGHPFDRELATLADSGLEFHVCPGTSSWNSIGGRVENARGNLESATRAACEHGARGLLITDWGDRGHHQPPLVSDFGFAAGLAMAWNASDRRSSADWARLVDVHAFGDTGGFLGSALLDLGRLDDANAARAENGSALFYSLAFAHEGWPHPRLPGLDEQGAVTSAEASRELGQRLRAWNAPDELSDGRAAELAWAAELSELGALLAAERCRAPDSSLPELERASELAARLEQLVEVHRSLWLRHSRPGGLERSVAVLQRVVRGLRGIAADV